MKKQLLAFIVLLFSGAAFAKTNPVIVNEKKIDLACIHYASWYLEMAFPGCAATAYKPVIFSDWGYGIVTTNYTESPDCNQDYAGRAQAEYAAQNNAYIKVMTQYFNHNPCR